MTDTAQIAEKTVYEPYCPICKTVAEEQLKTLREAERWCASHDVEFHPSDELEDA